jgi:hypothetical protein
MMISPPITRRSVLGLAVVGGAFLASGARAATTVFNPFVAAASGVDPGLCERAFRALGEHRHEIWMNDVIAIADFGAGSSSPRFHLIDLLRGETTTLLVAHGAGSDPLDSGFLQEFSNRYGSNATSEGAYVTAERYIGVHGVSRRLNGLDLTNDNARTRDVVIHAANYVSQHIIASEGKLGRSNGCFAVAESDIAQILDRLGKGRLLYAGRGGPPAAG